MSAEIVNLRRARKARARSQAEAQAEENRVKHGRTKAERQTEAKTRALEARKLDALRRERDEKKP
jgi:hypothetical protein